MEKLRILIINEYKIKGGTEQAVKKMKEIFIHHEHDVHVMYLSENKAGLDKNEYGMEFNGNLLNKAFFNNDYHLRVKKAIDKINPDLIIVNNVFSSPKSVFSALDGYCSYWVVHDYGAVCPKGTCIKDNGEVCSGIAKEKCWKNCTYQNSKLKLLAKELLLVQYSRLRIKYIDKFIAPSRKLTEYANDLFNCINIPNPVLIEEKVHTKPIKYMKHKFVYIGEIHDNKGIYELLKAFYIFSEGRDVELDIYGSIAKKEDDRFYELLKKTKKAHYCGYVNHEEIKRILREAYALIVPSKWMENYPTTVIEGMASKTLVIGSDRGGIPEQLDEKRGIIFNFGIDQLVKALVYADSIDCEEYKEITEHAFKYISLNNSYEMYYARFMNLIKKCKNI